MSFVKLDCGMLDSTLWVDREARELFITALLMAKPIELREPMKQIDVRSLELTGFEVPPGWYGFVEAAGTGIVRRAGMDSEAGLNALERLGSPDNESRTPDHEGRRLVRVDGGFISLNYDLYRTKDHNNAERCRRYRQKKLDGKQPVNNTVSHDTTCVSRRVDTHVNMQAEAEAEAEADTHTSYVCGKVASAPEHTEKEEVGNPKISKPFPPSIEEIVAHFESKGCIRFEAEKFKNFYESKNWMVGKNKMTQWRSSAANWINGWKEDQNPLKVTKFAQTRIDRGIGTSNEGLSVKYKGLKSTPEQIVYEQKPKTAVINGLTVQLL